MISALEPRTMLAATLNDGRLVVTGTDGDDVITLAQTKTLLTVTVNGKATTFESGAVRGIRVNALFGDDRVEARKMLRGLRINGGYGSDTLRGGAGNDRLHGGPEPETDLNGVTTPPPDRGVELSHDDLRGGPGNDTADYSGRLTPLHLSLGKTAYDDGVRGAQSTDGIPLPGTAEMDYIRPDVENVIGGSERDVIFGDHRPNRLYGGPGDDVLGGEELNGGSSPRDVFSGGKGGDEVTYMGHAPGVRLSLDGKANDGIKGERDNILPDVEQIEGSDGEDLIIGSRRTDALHGSFGNDTILGMGGNDGLLGGVGRDLLRGGAGDDFLGGSDSLDAVLEPENNVDTIFGDGGFDFATIDDIDIVRDAEKVEVFDPIIEMPEAEPNPDA